MLKGILQNSRYYKMKKNLENSTIRLIKSTVFFINVLLKGQLVFNGAQ